MNSPSRDSSIDDLLSTADEDVVQYQKDSGKNFCHMYRGITKIRNNRFRAKFCGGQIPGSCCATEHLAHTWWICGEFLIGQWQVVWVEECSAEHTEVKIA